MKVIRGKNLETTGIGAAFLAGLGTGIWKDKEELRASISVDREFSPVKNINLNYDNWKSAIKKTIQSK